MKLRLFILLWLSLFLAIGVGSYIYSSLQRKERQSFLDLQVRSHALLISESDFPDLDSYDPLKAEDMIQDILGGYRAGLFLLVRDSEGNILFENENSRRLEIDPDWETEWQTIDEGENIVRILSEEDPDRGRVLQVGLLVSKGVLRPIHQLQVFWNVTIFWFFGSMILAYFLASRFFGPLRKITERVKYLTYNLDVEHLEKASSQLQTRLWPVFLRKRDEFILFRESFVSLLQQVSTAIRLNSAHSARLVHEINTPLTILKTKIMKLRDSGDISAKKQLEDLIEDIDRLADFAKNYMNWSETTYKPLTSTELYAISLSKAVNEIVSDFSEMSGGRLSVSGSSDFQVIASRHDLEHLLQNLITNALKYSPANSPVEINIQGPVLTIKDQGAGIPEEVMKRLGEPFNKGSKEEGKPGSGIGLAWVKAISQKYSWGLNFDTSSSGTVVSVTFDTEDSKELA